MRHAGRVDEAICGLLTTARVEVPPHTPGPPSEAWGALRTGPPGESGGVICHPHLATVRDLLTGHCATSRSKRTARTGAKSSDPRRVHGQRPETSPDQDAARCERTGCTWTPAPAASPRGSRFHGRVPEPASPPGPAPGGPRTRARRWRAHLGSHTCQAGAASALQLPALKKCPLLGHQSRATSPPPEVAPNARALCPTSRRNVSQTEIA